MYYYSERHKQRLDKLMKLKKESNLRRQAHITLFTILAAYTLFQTIDAVRLLMSLKGVK